MKEYEKIVLIIGILIGFYFGLNKGLFNIQNKPRTLLQDISAFLTGAHIVRQGRVSDIYNRDLQVKISNEIRGFQIDNLLAYRNPPIIAYIFLPFTFLDLYLAIKLYIFLQLTLFLILVYYLYKKYYLPIYYIVIIILFYPFLVNLILGQIGLITFFGFYLIHETMKGGKNFLSGLSCVFLMIKPQHVILIPFLFLIVKKKWGFITGLIIVSLVYYGLNHLVYGIDFLPDYLRFVLTTEDIANGTALFYSSSLTAYADIFINTYLRDPVYKITLVLSVFVYLLGLFIFYLKQKDLSYDVSILVSLLFSYSLNIHTMPSDLLVFLIPFIIFSLSSDKKLRRISWLIYFIPWLLQVKLGGAVATIYILTAFYLLFEYPKNTELQLTK